MRGGEAAKLRIANIGRSGISENTVVVDVVVVVALFYSILRR